MVSSLKKIAKRILLVMIVIIVLQLILHYTKKEHHVDYTLMVDDQKYEITEMFSYDHQQSVYTLSLANQKKTFHFQFLEDYHKQSKVVEDIIAVSNDDISCVYPILKDNRASYVRCRDQENEFSYTVLQDKDPQLADKVVESLKEQKIDVVTESSSSKTYEGLTYYPTALDDIILSIWNYRGLYYLGAEQEENITFLQADQYENQYSIVVNDIYLTANTDQQHDFNEWYCTDLENGTTKTWKIDQEISFDSYFLGVVEDKAYLFDRDNLVEYEIDPKARKITAIGDSKKNGKYYDGSKWVERNIYDFKNEELLFPQAIATDYIKENYSDATVYEVEDAYFLVDNRDLYVIYKQFDTDPILLLNNYNMQQVQVSDQAIYFIDQDTIYAYHMIKGLQELATVREIQFNADNIYTIADRTT